MTRRFVVSLPATVYGQHSLSVFSEVYLLVVLCFCLHVHSQCKWCVWWCGACVHMVCVCVSLLRVCLFRVYSCTEKLLCVPDIAN